MKLGAYTIIQKIAEGGIADIYLAKGKTVRKNDKYLVCKCIKSSLAGDADFLESIINEVQLSVQMRHPNILEVFDLCSSDGQAYLTMEYMDASDLQQVIVKNAEAGRVMPYAVAIHVIGQAALGLHAAHELVSPNGMPLHLVHRDISPQNILLGWKGDIKIGDFGIARTSAMPDVTPPDVIKGKFGFMSPEQAWGDKLDRRADVFSLAVVLYESLLGTTLYPTDSVADTIRCARVAQYVKPSEIRPDFPKDLERVMLKALDLDRKVRYPTALEFKMALDQCVVNYGWQVTSEDWLQYLRSAIPSPRTHLPRMHACEVARDSNSIIRRPEAMPREASEDMEKTEQFLADDMPEDIRRLAAGSNLVHVNTLAAGPDLHAPTVQEMPRVRSWRPVIVITALSVIALVTIVALILILVGRH